MFESFTKYKLHKGTISILKASQHIVFKHLLNKQMEWDGTSRSPEHKKKFEYVLNEEQEEISRGL